jgi:hypothetical protein
MRGEWPSSLGTRGRKAGHATFGALFPDPAGCAFPKESILIEPAYLRQDKSRRGDIYAMGTGLYRKDTVMDLVVTSALQKWCLTHTSKSSDYAIRKAKNEMYMKDARSAGPIQNNSTNQAFRPCRLEPHEAAGWPL